MFRHTLLFLAGFSLLFFLSSCTTKQPPLVIDSVSVAPGTQVTRKGETLALTGTGIEVGTKVTRRPTCRCGNDAGNKP